MSLVGDIRANIADDTSTPSGLTGSPPSMSLLADFRVDIGDDSAVTASGTQVAGPIVSTDNAVARWNGSTGEAIQNSLATLDDNGNIVTPGGIELGGYFKRNVRIVTGAGSIAGISSDDIIMVKKNIGAATSVTLPSSPDAGRMIVVKDAKGDAFTNNISIQASAGTIDGLSSFVITQNYQAFTFIYNGTEWNVI